jgi:hypothetical protein
MNGAGESDGPIVPKKSLNKDTGAPESAEGIEGRGLAKENPFQQNQSIGHRAAWDWQNALERIRQAASLGTPARSIQGKSRMRQLLTYGSVRGAGRKACPYRDRPENQVAHLSDFPRFILLTRAGPLA